MPDMRLLVWLLLLLALAGCAASGGVAAATPLPQPTIPAVAEVLADPPTDRVEVIGYLYITGAGTALAGGLSFSQADPHAPLAAPGSIWMPDPPPLPADAPVESAGATRYLIVRAQGRLSARGSYGPGGSYPYQISEVILEPLGARDLSIGLLLANSGIYDNQPVRLSGQLLLGASTALLVDRLGSGGVPEASAQQIKLIGPIVDEPLRARLTAAPGGAAYFGPVQIIGIWRRSSLYPLAIIPAR
ncbi:hypothetical protein K2Z83_27785 [Oscillochloris sp. ZM17-4]|uniref:hypothetical protein n=1 Tax=Oscillochloris sp. ZM17-4 TaxID=2866714 RepID=UPI001C72AD9A|nr:hypothetical protein [Oscillochloris sp. ZM17-4]MBX0331458.1 hypothetical protein [Oscillochloris sp. ZM17-4]